mmetsp:Transcript_2208/g.3704  ORF Transcript_2208/g.3704 Transcript_2208/m.3704 type:complete len:226 (-) Transcript_2208:635-1312(-)
METLLQRLEELAEDDEGAGGVQVAPEAAHHGGHVHVGGHHQTVAALLDPPAHRGTVGPPEPAGHALPAPLQRPLPLLGRVGGQPGVKGLFSLLRHEPGLLVLPRRPVQIPQVRQRERDHHVLPLGWHVQVLQSNEVGLLANVWCKHCAQASEALCERSHHHTQHLVEAEHALAGGGVRVPQQLGQAVRPQVADLGVVLLEHEVADVGRRALHHPHPRDVLVLLSF